MALWSPVAKRPLATSCRAIRAWKNRKTAPCATTCANISPKPGTGPTSLDFQPFYSHNSGILVKGNLAIYPGSFDPLTNGHLDILTRGLEIFDRIIIAVSESEHKQSLFTIPERLSLLQKAVQSKKNVAAESFHGLLMDYAHDKGAIAIIRGLRAISDFEYEFQMALMNRHLSQNSHSDHEVETIFLMPDEKYTYLSSTLVKEVTRLGGDVKNFVPDFVEKALKEKLKK
ncbi:MAG: pantetheine-phosphate adenylyltransferase [Elusimicrobia bacterium]|nr:pantetheine-phosphate adenylyltransferase [Elusimicrobiota bacterium]